MNRARRKILISLGGAGIAALTPALFYGQKPVMQGTGDPSQPNGRGGGVDPTMEANARKTLLEQNEKDIKKNTDKLFQLASELKDEVDKTDSSKMLSLALVKKAEEIEKLARQIKERAKG